MINNIELLGKVSKLRECIDKDNPSCNHRYFDLEFEGALCGDHIEVCDWSEADIKDGDTVIVHGSLQSNQKNIDDGYTEIKEWHIMVYGTSGTSVVKVVA